jgi:hypothetical protein
MRAVAQEVEGQVEQLATLYVREEREKLQQFDAAASRERDDSGTSSSYYRGPYCTNPYCADPYGINPYCTDPYCPNAPYYSDPYDEE